MAEQRFDNIVRKFAEHRTAELTDGTHHTLSCSACGKPLVEVWVIRPDASITTDITVECPFCGDASFPIKVLGQYCIGYAEGSKARMANMTMDDNKVRVHTEVRQ